MASFQDFLIKKDPQLQEAFNSAPYELTFGKKNAGDIFFTFVDEDEKEFRIQFYTPQGLGKNVRQVFIGQKRGSTYPDAIARFKNPMRVIASMIEATKQYLATPLGKTIDGFAINFSKKALERGVTLLPKIIRQSGLKQKLNVMDLTYTPVPDRAFVWVVRKGKDPAQVFDGPKMKGVTWDDPDKVGDVPVQAIPAAAASGVTAPSVQSQTTTPAKSDDNTSPVFGQQEWNEFKEVLQREPGMSVTTEYRKIKGTMDLGGGVALLFSLTRLSEGGRLLGTLVNRGIMHTAWNNYTSDADFIVHNVAELKAAVKKIIAIKDEALNSEWNISIDAKNNGIFSTSVKMVGVNDVSLKSGDVDIIVRDGAMAKIAKTQSIAQVTVFDKGYVGRGEVERKLMAASDRQGMGWELKSGGKKVAYVEFGVGAVQSNPDYEAKGSWKYENRNRGKKAPQMVYTSNNPRSTYSAMVSADSSEPGTYVFHNSDGETIRGRSVDLIIGQARLVSPSIDMYNQFTKDAKEYWAKEVKVEFKFDPSSVELPSDSKLVKNGDKGFTIIWGVRFPEGGRYYGAVLNSTVIYNMDKGTFTAMNSVNYNGKNLNNPQSVERELQVLDSWVTSMARKYGKIAGEFSHLNSPTYNPYKLLGDQVEVTPRGDILFMGRDVTSSANRGFLIDMLGKATEKAEQEGATKEKNRKKTAGDLAAYAGSIDAAAPSTRDIDWQISTRNNGTVLDVSFELTFRRDTHLGGFLNHRDQILRCNAYLKTVYNDAKEKGYNVTEPNYVTHDGAERIDQEMMDNGEDPYSEYEQSIGGSLQVML